MLWIWYHRQRQHIPYPTNLEERGNLLCYIMRRGWSGSGRSLVHQVGSIELLELDMRPCNRSVSHNRKMNDYYCG
jgi:hypothetical protein